MDLMREFHILRNKKNNKGDVRMGMGKIQNTTYKLII